MGKKEEQTVKKCVIPYHVLIVVVLVLCVFVGIVSAGNVNDETKNSLSSTMAKSQPEEPSSILTITILNETTASCEWFINVPGEFSSYIPYETKRLEENINSLEKGVEDLLLLQEVKNIKIIEGNETIILQPRQENGSLIYDISLFARLRNGFKERVYLVSGCRTLGVMGAAKAFFDEESAPRNIIKISQLVEDNDFVVVFKTKPFYGTVSRVNLNMDSIDVLYVFDESINEFKRIV